MLKLKSIFLTTVVIMSVGAATVLAGTVVSETSDGRLMVIDTRGKPPHKRQFISPSSADYARYADLADNVTIATSTTRRSGPPGKSLPAQAARIESVNEADISQFARLEESDSAASSRMWRGAPGKGRQLPR